MNHLKRWALFAALTLITAALALAGCGGSTHRAAAPVVKPPVNTPKAAVVTAKVVNQHVCDLRDYNLSCPLPIASVATITRGVDPVTQGVDFGWSCPVGSAQSFGASYLSYDTSKDWSGSCINTFHAQHKGTVAVWEAGANDAQGGYSLGFSQAQRASQELSALGAPKGQPFDMAIDCDCAGSSLVNYFKGANAAEPGRVNAYGGYYQLAYLSAQHLVGHLNWQTYAWSGGRWLSGSVAPLEQYLNSSSVDYDRAIAANYAQWPAPSTVHVLCDPTSTPCYLRFATAKCQSPISFPAPCKNQGTIAGPFFAKSGICSHGCDERGTVYEYDHLRPHWRTHHRTLLALRYRLQWLQRRITALDRSRSKAAVAATFGYWREHQLWERGFLAKRVV